MKDSSQGTNLPYPMGLVGNKDSGVLAGGNHKELIYIWQVIK